jgi:hypothetical protein
MILELGAQRGRLSGIRPSGGYGVFQARNLAVVISQILAARISHPTPSQSLTSLDGEASGLNGSQELPVVSVTGSHSTRSF